MRALHVTAATFVATIVLCGSLGAPFLPDEVPFESVKREHFDAFGVVRERGPASEEPLTVRVRIVGEADEATAEAFAWLREHANVVIVEDPAGVPLVLTDGDLSATSGRATLGATVPAGMAIETREPHTTPCIIAHELLHFLGLPHVSPSKNIMHKMCTRDKLATAELDAAQRLRIDTISRIVATTPRGVVTWASR